MDRFCGSPRNAGDEEAGGRTEFPKAKCTGTEAPYVLPHKEMRLYCVGLYNVRDGGLVTLGYCGRFLLSMLSEVWEGAHTRLEKSGVSPNGEEHSAFILSN